MVPLLLWLGMMQLAYWGTEISQCPGTDKVLSCTREQIVNGGWPHAPALLAGYFAKTAYYDHGACLSFAIAAAALFLLWFFLSVNSNSLHQLYRDRLGQAFLIKRENAAGTGDEIAYADDFELTAIDPARTPYHLINTALNVPGSKFANRRGRNADFFIFSPASSLEAKRPDTWGPRTGRSRYRRTQHRYCDGDLGCGGGSQYGHGIDAATFPDDSPSSTSGSAAGSVTRPTSSNWRNGGSRCVGVMGKAGTPTSPAQGGLLQVWELP